ncbi:MAG: hypothetical protein ACW981_04065 [Candidatus Hodarchaeales archaeon]
MHETSFLFFNTPEKCTECNQPIFDFDDTPETWKHRTCRLDTCNESIHSKCYENHLDSHPVIIKSSNDVEKFRMLLGLNKNIDVDRCILCKRIKNLKEQLCQDCQTIQ